MKVNRSLLSFGIILILFSAYLINTPIVSNIYVVFFGCMFSGIGFMFIVFSIRIKRVKRQALSAELILKQKMREEEEILLLLSEK